MANYLKDPDTGDVYLEGDNPLRYWTSSEWAEQIKALKDRLAQLQGQAAAMPQPKVKPDQETLDFYNTHMTLLADDGQIKQMQAELAEMEAV